MAADYVMMSQSSEWSNAYFRSLTCPTHKVPLGVYLLENRRKRSGLSARLVLRDAEVLPLETRYACMADPTSPHDVYVKTDRNGVYANLGSTGAPTDPFPIINDFSAGFIPEIDPQGRIRAYPIGLQGRQAQAPVPVPQQTPQPVLAPVVAPTIDAQALARALGPVLGPYMQTRTRRANGKPNCLDLDAMYSQKTKRIEELLKLIGKLKEPYDLKISDSGEIEIEVKDGFGYRIHKEPKRAKRR